MKYLFILTLLVSLSLSETINKYTITVQVKPTKINGKSWDVSGGSPDIVVVVEGMRYFFESCRDRYRCQVSFTSHDTKWYFEIYDRDMMANDLIGNGECGVNQKCTLGQAVIDIK